MNIYLITGNENKLREAEEILGVKVKNKDLDLEEIQELDEKKVSEHKARQAWQIVKEPVVVWDQAVYIACLNNFPGPLIKWFWDQVGAERVCQIAESLGNNKISTKTILTYFDGKDMKFFCGEIRGIIPPKPRGENGFGWDPIFMPLGQSKTFAEMSALEKNSISMHKIALEKLKKFIEK